MTRFTRVITLDGLAHNVRGLLLAACLQPKSVQILLGGNCTLEEAKLYQDEAKARVSVIRSHVENLRRNRA